MPQIIHIINSHYNLSYTSFNISSENLVSNQILSPSWYFSLFSSPSSFTTSWYGEENLPIGHPWKWNTESLPGQVMMPLLTPEIHDKWDWAAWTGLEDGQSEQRVESSKLKKKFSSVCDMSSMGHHIWRQVFYKR